MNELPQPAATWEHIAPHLDLALGQLSGAERDAVLLGVRDPAARARLIVPLRPAPEVGREALAAQFDIVLGDHG